MLLASETPTPSTSDTVPVNYTYSQNLPDLLQRLEVSLVLSTYQAGKVITIGSHKGELVFGFANFNQAMGLARTPTGLLVVSRNEVWTLPASREIAPSLAPTGSHDVAFLTRSAHLTGQVMGHDLAWGDDQIWLVNTAFNCLCTIEAPWSFRPRWLPAFISRLEPGDCCHLNGVAMEEHWGAPAYVTALGSTDSVNGWREHKLDGGCLIDVASSELVARGLCMPHSPRLYQGELWVLDSGHGALSHCDPHTTSLSRISQLPGFTRGLDFFAGHAFVGLSRIRESAVFGGLPIGEHHDQLRCGAAIVDLGSGQVVAHLFFNSGVEEVFSVSVLPGIRNPKLLGPDPKSDSQPMPWLVPQDPAELVSGCRPGDG
jgi:uncharacterized protein (TIGR03032 family)